MVVAAEVAVETVTDAQNQAILLVTVLNQIHVVMPIHKVVMTNNSITNANVMYEQYL